MLRNFIAKTLNPMGKTNFLMHLGPTGAILDVGCGNNSPYKVKQLLPQWAYTGIDVSDYNQTRPNLADRYIVTDAEHFDGEIAGLSGQFDAVLSYHNLEHCNHRLETLRAMIAALKPGGEMLLAFPSAHTVDLPPREGTLCYYDDKTHLDAPPDIRAVLEELEKARMQIRKAVPYRPGLLRLIGWLNEPGSRRAHRVKTGTWALYGFENIIWARKPGAPA